MGMGGVVINFAAKTRDAIRDIGRMESELKDVDKSTDKVGAAMDDMADDTNRAADQMRQAARQMARGIDQGADQIDRSTDGLRANMADTGKEAGAEFVGNIAEGIGSGQANLNDVVSGTLGGLTNLAATLGGPVGLAAAGAAAGIGLVFSAIKGEAEKAKAALDGTRDALDGIADLSSKAATKAIFDKWITDAQETAGKIENVNDALTAAGVTADDFQTALAGDPAAIERVRAGLAKQGQEIIRSKQETGKLTAAQQRYLDTMPTILKDIKAQDAAIGAVRREQEAIARLTGDTADNTSKWNGDLSDTAGLLAAIRRDQESIEGSHPVNFIVTTRDKNGRPVHLGPAGLSAPAPAGVGATAMAAPITVNVNATGIPAPRNVRELVSILETHQARMGRKPGQPRAVAW